MVLDQQLQKLIDRRNELLKEMLLLDQEATALEAKARETRMKRFESKREAEEISRALQQAEVVAAMRAERERSEKERKEMDDLRASLEAKERMLNERLAALDTPPPSPTNEELAG